MIRPVRDRRDLDRFIRFPWSIYGGDPHWVPPLRELQRKTLERKEGVFFNDGFGSTAEYFLCCRGDDVVGRIAAIRNERHLKTHGDGVGFFGFFESVGDPGVASELFDAAGRWLSDQGLEILRGPTSFTLNEASGVTVDGFDLRPSVEIGHTPVHYADLLQGAGFRKSRDLLVYQTEMAALEPLLFQFEKIADAAVAEGYSTRPISRKNLKEDFRIYSDVFSKAWERNWGAFPFLREDFLHMVGEMGPFFDERLGFIAFFRGKPVGVFLAAPDPWELFHKFDGKLGLRQMWKVMREKHRISRYRVFLMGILPGRSAAPLGPLWFREIIKYRELYPEMKTVEFSWILEDNVPTRKLVESFGARIVKRQRIYERYL